MKYKFKSNALNKEVEGEIVKTNAKTVWLKLSDGNTIKKKKRQIERVS